MPTFFVSRMEAGAAITKDGTNKDVQGMKGRVAAAIFIIFIFISKRSVGNFTFERSRKIASHEFDFGF